MTPRIGVACKFLSRDGTNHPTLRFRDLSRQTYRAHGPRILHEIAFHNARTLHAVVCTLGRGPERNRMFRMGNGVLPCLTLPEANTAWGDVGFVRDLSNAYAKIGARARQDGVRLSTHPDQFIVPNSIHLDVCKRGILELDCWGAWAERMGLGPEHGFCVNIHAGPSLDRTRDGLVRSWEEVRNRMSRSAWRVLTVENDDKVWSAWDTIHAATRIGFRPVIDPHHHWCVTRRWPHPQRLRDLVVPLWPHSRPKMHFSLPRGGHFAHGACDCDVNGLPRHDRCVGARVPHAQLPWVPGAARYARSLLAWTDLLLELKAKNLARTALFQAIDDLPVDG